MAPTAAIPFEENHGQFDPQVAFAARAFGGTVFVTHDGNLVTTKTRELGTHPTTDR